MAIRKSFFRRSLAFAVAMGSLTAASGVYASNLANFSTSSWTGKSTSLGSFGAGYGADFTLDLTNGALTGEASGNAQIQLFGTKMTIAELTASANINDASAKAAGLSVELVGTTVYDESVNDGIDFDLTDVEDYDDTFCVEFFDVSTTFTIGPVPVTMTAGAEGCATLLFEATPQVTSHQAILNMSLTPGITSELTAAVGAGTSSFSAGVEANVTLLDFTLPMTLDPQYNFSTASFDYDSTGEVSLSMLDGSVDAYVKADLGLFDVKYSYELFDWDGISKDWYLWSTGVPSASNPLVTIEGGKATGSYTYADTAGTDEGGSTYVWYRNSSATDTGRAQITGETSSSRVIVAADKDKYIQFCVTPKNGNGTPGTQQCSTWESVGKIASFYEDNSYSGTNLAIAYEKSLSGTCFNLDDYVSWFDNDTSSYKLYAPAGSSATFHFYKAYDCSDTSSSEYLAQTVSANGNLVDDDLGTSWNDRLSSIKVTFDEIVTAENVAVSYSGNKASAAYTFSVSNSVNTTESGSTYVWHRASNSSGSGSTTISGSTGSSHTLTYADDQKYLQVCVTPSNGDSTGSQVCSGWHAVGHLLKFFQDDNQGGSNIAIAWEKSERETCFNMSDYSFNDKVSSYNWYNNSNASSTVWLYKDANCSGTVATRTVAAGSSEAITSVTSTFGSSWNDVISSFKVSWSSSVAISTPSVTIYGNKSTESHTYSDSQGLSEAATYQWYRASNSSGTDSAAIDNAASSTYTLSGDDNKKYLRVCVLSSNGVNVDESTQCSGWTYVGSLLRLFGDTNLGGASINIAYQKSASGTCFNLADFSFDEMTSSYTAYAPTTGSATFYTYRHTDCSSANPTNVPLSANTSASYNFGGVSDNSRSSIKVTY